MGTITAQSIIDKAAILLSDGTNVRWTVAELLGWLNDSQRQITLIRPDASVVTANITLVAGTKQAIPSTGLRLIDVIRNMGVGGATPGRSVRLVDREVLDAQSPDWHSSTAAASIKHFIFDQRNPKTFYVFPPADATSPTVEALYSVAPAEVAAAGNTITLDDIYQNPILDWMLYRAFSKDSEYARNHELAMRHLAAFQGALGVKTEVDLAVSPNRNAPPFNPGSAGGLR
jgi:hypothetical protein